MTIRYKHPREGITPRGGDKLYFYEPSTTTEKDVFSNAAASTPLDQPVEADNAGVFPTIYMSSELYRVLMRRAGSPGTQVFDEDTYDPGVPAGTDVDGSVLPIALGGTNATTAAGARGQLGAASASSVTTLSATVSEHDTLIDTGLHSDGDRFGDLASQDEVTADDLATSFGNIVRQVVDATPYTTNAQLSTTIPNDDTAPTSSEGTEILTASITPSSASNKVRIRVDGFGTPNGSNSQMIVALFRGTTCISAKAQGSNGISTNIGFTFIDSPATISSTTYSVRVGSHTLNVYMNGTSSGRLFGGTAGACTMRLEELEVH